MLDKTDSKFLVERSYFELEKKINKEVGEFDRVNETHLMEGNRYSDANALKITVDSPALES